MNEKLSKDLNNLIYKIDGVEVMLDSDLAKLYEVETKRINEAVKNNPLKFPKRFSWKLTDEDSKNFLVENFDQKKETRGGKYKNPRVFTEQGVAMLATILKSEKAIQTSIAIMDAFVNMRNYIRFNEKVLPNRVLLLEERVDFNTKRLDELFDMFNYQEIIKDFVFFEGEFFEAHAALLDIFGYAYEELIIIDNYAGKELLNIVKNIDKKIIIVSANIDEVLKEKYEKEYHNVTFIHNNSFHDRFIIVDRRYLYSCGSSFKDMGKKCFGIHEIRNVEYLNRILNEIEI